MSHVKKNKYSYYLYSSLFFVYFIYTAHIPRDNHCSDCHSLNLRGSAHGSSLLGKEFITKWEEHGLNKLFEYTKEKMPPGKIGSISDEDLLKIMLHSNN